MTEIRLSNDTKKFLARCFALAGLLARENYPWDVLKSAIAYGDQLAAVKDDENK